MGSHMLKMLGCKLLCSYCASRPPFGQKHQVHLRQISRRVHLTTALSCVLCCAQHGTKLVGHGHVLKRIPPCSSLQLPCLAHQVAADHTSRRTPARNCLASRLADVAASEPVLYYGSVVIPMIFQVIRDAWEHSDDRRYEAAASGKCSTPARHAARCLAQRKLAADIA
jgi:hypothetical protein